MTIEDKGAPATAGAPAGWEEWRRKTRIKPTLYAPPAYVERLKARPDWPDIEREMKKIYGKDWELVACSEGCEPITEDGGKVE